MKAIIIEDEKRTAQDLQQILQDLMPDIEILTVIDSVEGSIDYLAEKGCPDLIFSDIQLADGLSFEIFQEVKITCPIIFCTAFDEYAIQAFNTNGIDYLLKPFDKKVIGRSLEKYKNLRGMFEKKSPSETTNFDQIKDFIDSLQPVQKTSFLVNYKGKYLPIPTHEIAFFYIEHEIAFLYKYSGERYAILHTMDELERMAGKQFYRANRQFLVNFDSIQEVEPHFNRKLFTKLKVQTPEPIIVSKLKVTDFLTWMGGK